MEIRLENRTEEHVRIFWDKTQDEEIQRLFPFGADSLEKSLELYAESLGEDATSYGKVIIYQGEYVGDIWCYSIDEVDEKMAMLSIVIFEKKLWGKGVASKAAKDFIKEVGEKFDIEKLGVYTYDYNKGSKDLLKKLGFVEVERFVEDGVESIYGEFCL